MSAVVWFRRDLRLLDNPAWASAGRSSGTATALWVLDPGLWQTAGAMRRALLADHLVSLDASLRVRGGRLRVEVGDPADVVPRVADEVGAPVVHANADATPHARRRDGAVADALRNVNIGIDWHWGTMVQPPNSVLAGTGSVSRVFTPFFKAWSAIESKPWPQGGPERIAADQGDAWAALSGDPSPMPGGELAADARLSEFLDRVDNYLDARDRPAVAGTSELSADLRFGVLSPRHVIDVVGTATKGRAGFVRQLAWRDWYAHLLWELPHLRHHAMKPELDQIRWRNDPIEIKAWQDGRTGYPMVDAGMRQLLATGTMHNRVRMVCASFLVKDLLVDWRIGERWFRRLLLDGDVAQNVGNWQWCAGTGPDAAPYFRVFNPVTQSRKFDGGGEYLRRWIPELAALSDRQIHAPWEVAPLDMAAAGVVVGETYPAPLVDHGVARDRALAAYAAAKANRGDRVD